MTNMEEIKRDIQQIKHDIQKIDRKLDWHMKYTRNIGDSGSGGYEASDECEVLSDTMTTETDTIPATEPPYQSVLHEHHINLVERISTSILDSLLQDDVITPSDHENIHKLNHNRKDQIRYLLLRVHRYGPHAFEKFCRTLKKNDADLSNSLPLSIPNAMVSQNKASVDENMCLQCLISKRVDIRDSIDYLYCKKLINVCTMEKMLLHQPPSEIVWKTVFTDLKELNNTSYILSILREAIPNQYTDLKEHLSRSSFWKFCSCPSLLNSTTKSEGSNSVDSLTSESSILKYPNTARKSCPHPVDPNTAHQSSTHMISNECDTSSSNDSEETSFVSTNKQTLGTGLIARLRTADKAWPEKESNRDINDKYAFQKPDSKTLGTRETDKRRFAIALGSSVSLDSLPSDYTVYCDVASSDMKATGKTTLRRTQSEKTGDQSGIYKYIKFFLCNTSSLRCNTSLSTESPVSFDGSDRGHSTESPRQNGEHKLDVIHQSSEKLPKTNREINENNKMVPNGGKRHNVMEFSENNNAVHQSNREHKKTERWNRELYRSSSDRRERPNATLLRRSNTDSMFRESAVLYRDTHSNNDLKSLKQNSKCSYMM